MSAALSLGEPTGVRSRKTIAGTVSRHRFPQKLQTAIGRDAGN